MIDLSLCRDRSEAEIAEKPRRRLHETFRHKGVAAGVRVDAALRELATRVRK